MSLEVCLRSYETPQRIRLVYLWHFLVVQYNHSCFQKFGQDRPYRPSSIILSTATTTVSRFFSDKAGAAPPTGDSESLQEDANIRKRPSLLQRLHIHPPAKRSRSPHSLTLRPDIASSTVNNTTRPRISIIPTKSDNDSSITEIINIMPQILTIGTPPNPGAVKRQRSEERRDVHTQVTPVGPKVTNGAPLKLSARVPPYLDKTKAGEYYFQLVYECLLIRNHRDCFDLSGPRMETKISPVSCTREPSDIAIQG